MKLSELFMQMAERVKEAGDNDPRVMLLLREGNIVDVSKITVSRDGNAYIWEQMPLIVPEKAPSVE
jgi:hypothetical protein